MLVYRLSKGLSISPSAVESMTLYDTLVYWHELRREQEVAYYRELQHYQMLAMVVHGDPKKFMKMLDEAMEKGRRR